MKEFIIVRHAEHRQRSTNSLEKKNTEQILLKRRKSKFPFNSSLIKMVELNSELVHSE